MMVEPGFNFPPASARSIMALAMRSFTDPAGLKYSSFARRRAGSSASLSIWVSSSKGVLPISWSEDV